jgi:thiamine-monophosphate kinase
VRVTLHGDRIPVSDELRDYAAAAAEDPLDWALYGGEDYELVGTVRQEYAAELASIFERAGQRIWFVGEVDSAVTGAASEVGVTLVRAGTAAGVPVGKRGYNHFA